MIPDFVKLLRLTTESDESAWKSLEGHFQAKTISDEETLQVVVYFKQMSKRFPHATYIRAFLFDHGYGEKPDPEMAFILMREAAAKGHPGAMYEVGRRFMEGLGIEQHYGNAAQWLTAAAKSPYFYAPAMNLLGLMYEKGLGVDPDSEKAQEWYSLANR